MCSQIKIAVAVNFCWMPSIRMIIVILNALHAWVKHNNDTYKFSYNKFSHVRVQEMKGKAQINVAVSFYLNTARDRESESDTR